VIPTFIYCGAGWFSVRIVVVVTKSMTPEATLNAHCIFFVTIEDFSDEF